MEKKKKNRKKMLQGGYNKKWNRNTHMWFQGRYNKKHTRNNQAANLFIKVFLVTVMSCCSCCWRIFLSLNVSSSRFSLVSFFLGCANAPRRPLFHPRAFDSQHLPLQLHPNPPSLHPRSP